MTDLAYRSTHYDRMHALYELCNKLQDAARTTELDYLQEKIAQLTQDRERVTLEASVAVEALHKQIVEAMGWRPDADGTFTHEHLGCAYSLEGAVKQTLAVYQAVTITLEEAKAACEARAGATA